MADLNIKADVARHLDMSERNLTEVLRGLNIDYRTTHLDDIRTAYIRRLRETAAGRGNDNSELLTISRIRETNASAELKELQVKEKAGELFSVKDFEPYLLTMVIAAKQELLTLPNKIKHYIKAIHQIDIDLTMTEEVVHDALSQLSTNLQSILLEHDNKDDRGVETAD